MKFSSRARLSELSFPPYAHLPGKTTHPNKPGGHQFDRGEAKARALDPHKPFEHQIYCYGIDLLNHGYYWESHVAFEAIWHAQSRRGDVADFLKALIKIGAAGLKQRLGQEQAAQAHLQRAFDLFEDLRIKSTVFCGLDLDELCQLTPDRIELTPRS